MVLRLWLVTSSPWVALALRAVVACEKDLELAVITSGSDGQTPLPPVDLVIFGPDHTPGGENTVVLTIHRGGEQTDGSSGAVITIDLESEPGAVAAQIVRHARAAQRLDPSTDPVARSVVSGVVNGGREADSGIARGTTQGTAGELRDARLSPREREILAIYSLGTSARAVAERTGIAKDTVAFYVGRIRAKYAVVGRAAPTRIELYQRAIEDGLIMAVQAGPAAR